MNIDIKIENGKIKKLNIDERCEMILLKDSLKHLDEIGQPIESLSYEFFESYTLRDFHISNTDLYAKELTRDEKYELDVFMVAYVIHTHGLSGNDYKAITKKLRKLADMNDNIIQYQPISEFEESIKMLIEFSNKIIKAVFNNDEVKWMIVVILIVSIIGLIIT